MDEIKRGRSMKIINKEHNFIISAIVGGIIPQELGTLSHSKKKVRIEKCGVLLETWDLRLVNFISVISTQKTLTYHYNLWSKITTFQPTLQLMRHGVKNKKS